MKMKSILIEILIIFIEIINTHMLIENYPITKNWLTLSEEQKKEFIKYIIDNKLDRIALSMVYWIPLIIWDDVYECITN